MTEVDWLNCSDPQIMLDYLRGKTSERKLRLFAVACCLSFPFGRDERFLQAVQVTEGYADGQATKAALKRARQSVRAARYNLSVKDEKVRGEWGVYWLAEVAASEHAYQFVGEEMHRLAAQGILDLSPDTRGSVCSLLRCIFGSLWFRSCLPDPVISRWNGGTIPKLAQAIYNDAAFDRLPVLADALEEAGCTDAEMLNHCRGPGPHVKGCWPLDLLLGKG